MDTLQNYDSSDSDSDAPEELENEIKENSQKSNTNTANDNTRNTRKSVKIPNNLIPRQLLNKKKENSEKYYSEAYIAKSYALSKNKSSPSDTNSNNNSLDLFGIGKINNNYKQNLDYNSDNIDTGATGFKDKVASIITESDQITEEIQNQDNNNTNKITRKRKIGDISDDQIIEFNANEFYQKNNELIQNGVLDSNKIIQENSKITYYSNNGKNQLSDIIKFTERNYDKLNKKKSKK